MSFTKSVRWALMAACFYGMMTISFVNAGHAFWLPSILADLGLSEAAGGLFLSCAFWGTVATVLVAGLLADRYGFRLLLVGSALCEFISLLTVSHASTGWSAYAAVCLGGIGTGTILALATPVAFSQYPHIRTRVSNLVQSFTGIGSVVVVLVGLALFHGDWSWRDTYRLMAVLVMPYGLVFLFLPLPMSACRNGAWLKGWELIWEKSFRLLLVGIFLVAIIQVGVGMWFPSYVEIVVGGTRSASGMGMILCGAVTALGMWLSSALSERLGARRLSVIGGLLSMAALLVVAMTTHTIVVIGCFGVLTFGISGLGPAILANAGDRFPASGVSMYSLLFAMANLGCATGPLVIGLLAGLWNLRVTMAVMAIGPLGAVLVLLTLLPRRHRVLDISTGAGSRD